MTDPSPPVASNEMNAGSGPGVEAGPYWWLWIGLGLGFVTCSTLLLEIVLTRIFSAIFMYHYGFMTICLALLGVGLGGIVVYIYPERFPRNAVGKVSASVALMFAATTLLSLLIFHWIVSDPAHWPRREEFFSFHGFLGFGYRALVFIVTGIPFFFAGLCVAIPISRCTERIGILYSADLIGAAAGAALVIPLISLIGAHQTVVASAIFASVSAICFSIAASSSRTALLAVSGVLACLIALPLAAGTDFFRIRYSKAGSETSVIAERWNSFSRVAVYDLGNRPSFGWHLGKGAPRGGASHLWIKIDGGSGTPMIAFDGSFDKVQYLRYDISAIGYQIRAQKSALIIGSGGGRDILTAKLFGVERVHAVEINPIIIDFVRKDFRKFSGSPYDLPGVGWSAVDGRSYVAGASEVFDHIQISAVDTYAALAAGALSLVENGLYTVEAFEDYYDHLSPDGILTITRPWTRTALPVALRTTDLVRAAWRKRGVVDVGQHIVIVAPPAVRPKPYRWWGTLIASRRPFTDAELQRIRGLANQLGFVFLYEPSRSDNPEALEALLGPDHRGFLRDYPYDVSAPTDDRPFFFFFEKLFQRPDARSRLTVVRDHTLQNWRTQAILLQLFGFVTALVVICSFGVPLLLGRLRFGAVSGAGRGLLYFAAIGLGFIMVEISLIQRYTLLLGRPLYAFAVILGTILVCSGLGSFVSHSFRERNLVRLTVGAIAAIVAGVLAHVMVIPAVLHGSMGLALWVRLLLTIVTIAPLGFVMGMPLPLGMRLMERESPQALAWGWGVNGSLSVMGTVLSVAVSVLFGVTYTLLAGAFAYLLAGIASGLRLARARV